jgi:polysaccharide biosynthesis protein PslG
MAVALSLALSGAAHASVPRSFFGTVPWLSFQGQDFQRLEQARVTNARTPFFWPTIEPSKGDYSWSGTDRFVGTLALYHIRTLPFLNGSPSWVAGDARHPPLKTKKAKKSWKRFVKACVKRYGKKGVFWRLHPNIPKVPITAWQIWNEQNNSKYYGPKPKPKAYGKLVRLAKNAARSVDKHATIVLGGMARDPEPEHSMAASRYLNKLYKVKGAKRLFNVVAVHPYSPTIRDLKRQMSSLHKVIRRHHDNARMWVTEVGWGSAQPNKKYPLLKGVQGQKQMLKKAFRAFIRNRRHWDLKRVYWFLWRDAAPDAPVNCSFCKSSGLFTYDYKPKPAWQAFLDITHR